MAVTVLLAANGCRKHPIVLSERELRCHCVHVTTHSLTHWHAETTPRMSGKGRSCTVGAVPMIGYGGNRDTCYG
jgi:hypothetical protein